MAKELLRRLQTDRAPVDVIEDVELVRKEVARCREILDLMAMKAGSPRGDRVEAISLQQLLARTCAPLNATARLDIDLGEAAAEVMSVPVRSVEHAIRAVIENALETEPPDRCVEVRACVDGELVTPNVRDHGSGMTTEVLHRATEPFYSTKAAHKGMGMGLFLAESVVQRLGGELELASEPGNGTLVSLSWLRDVPMRDVAGGEVFV